MIYPLKGKGLLSERNDFFRVCTSDGCELIKEGNHFDKSNGIPDYRNHFIYGRASGVPVVDTTVTGGVSSATGKIVSVDSDRQIVSLQLTTGMFRKGESLTTSDGKTFDILEGNPATAAAKQNTCLLYTSPSPRDQA